MKKHLKAVFVASLSLFSILHVFVSPTIHTTSALDYAPGQTLFAADGSVETTFFGNVKDDGKGCSVYLILNLVLDILTGAVGIAAVVGITIVGTQYLTSRGNEQQATKARNRLLEIVLGLVAYVMLYSALNFLLPGGKFNNSTTCSSTSNTSSSSQNNQQNTIGNKTYTSSNKVSENSLTLGSQITELYSPSKMARLIDKGKLAPSPVCTNCTWNKRIAQTAELLSWEQGTNESKYTWNYASTQNFKSWSDLKGGKPNKAYRIAFDGLYPNHGFTNMSSLGADCGKFVRVVVKYSGIDRRAGFGCPNADEYFSNSKRWKKVSVNQAQAGDVCVNKIDDQTCHIAILLSGNRIAEANHHGKKFAHITGNTNCKGFKTAYRANVKAKTT